MAGDQMEDEEGRAPLLQEQHAPAMDSLTLDWRGHPADTRHDLGGWKCVIVILGAVGLVYAVFFSVLGNLVVYLVQVLGDSNPVAAKTVTTLSGTAFLSSFVGALVSDAYLGRLWASVLFAFLSLLGFTLISIAAQLISKDMAETFFLASLYFMFIAIGCSFPNLLALGADQLSSSIDKAKYFSIGPITICASQVFAITVMTYLDGLGMWVLGFWLCTAAAGLAVALLIGVAWACRQCRASGNPLCRIAQVLTAATRNWNRIVPIDSSLLYEIDGELSVIPGCRKLPHTSSLSFLDKAAIPTPAEHTEQVSSWRLCTVTQVEEVKCLIKVLPVGAVSTCIGVAGAQSSTLFVEQASATKTQVASWLAIPPASLQFFSIAGSFLTGLILNLGGAHLLGRCLGCGKRKGLPQRATSLQMLGLSLVVSIAAMVLAAVVEAYRLAIAREGAYILSVVWLIPQTLFLGASTVLFTIAAGEFFYNEVSDGMRALSTCIILLFIAGGNYLSSLIVFLTTYFSSGGHSWIASDLDEGHLDYFYWFLAAFLTLIFGMYLIYAHSYTYRHVQAS